MKSPSTPAPLVFVFSADCTHHLPDEGLVLEGGAVNQIPAEHLNRCLELPGVRQVFPVPPINPDDLLLEA